MDSVSYTMLFQDIVRNAQPFEEMYSELFVPFIEFQNKRSKSCKVKHNAIPRYTAIYEGCNDDDRCGLENAYLFEIVETCCSRKSADFRFVFPKPKTCSCY